MPHLLQNSVPSLVQRQTSPPSVPSQYGHFENSAIPVPLVGAEASDVAALSVLHGFFDIVRGCSKVGGAYAGGNATGRKSLWFVLYRLPIGTRLAFETQLDLPFQKDFPCECHSLAPQFWLPSPLPDVSKGPRAPKEIKVTKVRRASRGQQVRLARPDLLGPWHRNRCDQFGWLAARVIDANCRAIHKKNSYRPLALAAKSESMEYASLAAIRKVRSLSVCVVRTNSRFHQILKDFDGGR